MQLLIEAKNEQTKKNTNNNSNIKLSELHIEKSMSEEVLCHLFSPIFLNLMIICFHEGNTTEFGCVFISRI